MILLRITQSPNSSEGSVSSTDQYNGPFSVRLTETGTVTSPGASSLESGTPFRLHFKDLGLSISGGDPRTPVKRMPRMPGAWASSRTH